MRALVLTTSYPVSLGLLSGSFVRDLLRGLTTRGWEFEVVVPGLAGAAMSASEPSLRVHPVAYPGNAWCGGLAHRRGLPETLAAEPWKWGLVPGLLLAMRAETERRIAAAARRGDPFDLLWSHWLFPSGVLGAEIASRHALAHVLTAHGADVHQLERLARLPGARAALGRLWSGTALSAPVEATALRVERALHVPGVRVCPLPAGPDAYRGRDFITGPEAVRLLFLGRFESVKGPDRLLEACARVPASRLAGVTLAGAGSLEPELRARARTLAHPVEFTGVLEGEAKRAAVECAHLMVLPSRRLSGGRGEGFPHAAMEALAAGTPVIAPEGGALGDLVSRTGAGVTFEPGGSEPECAARLACTIEALAASPARLATLAARARAVGRAFAAPRALASWQSFLRASAHAGERA